MASKQNPASAQPAAESGVGTFRIVRPIRTAAGTLYRPGQEAAFLAAHPSGQELDRHRATKSITGTPPKAQKAD